MRGLMALLFVLLFIVVAAVVILPIQPISMVAARESQNLSPLPVLDTRSRVLKYADGSIIKLTNAQVAQLIGTARQELGMSGMNSTPAVYHNATALGNVSQMASTDIVTAAPVYVVDPITWLWPKETNTVTISCLVGTNGKVKRLVKTDVSSLLLPAFERAKDHWKFTPAMRNGKPVESIVTVRFTYVLKPQGYQCSASVDDIGR